MKYFRGVIEYLDRIFSGSRAVAPDDICPVCRKADQVIPIRYGKPNDRLMQMAKAGKVRLGGCDKSAGLSNYCKRDDIEF